jgi:HAD superfamily hydrolase (TIGR01459 family)
MPPSQRPPFIDGLAPIAANYDALLCDAWGVIHDGRALFPGAEEAMIEFRRRRGPVVVLTNAPRPNAVIPPQLDRLGLSREAYDAVVTSGDATRAEIGKRGGAPAFRIGPEKDDPLFEGLKVPFAPLEEADYLICTGLADDQRESPEDYRTLLIAAAARGLVMICANPDLVVRWGGRLIYCAGALAEIYERIGGAVVYGGKPHRPIYDLALARIAAIAGRALDPARVLAVGDGVATDIKGAAGHGLDAVLVAGAGGVHEGPASADAVAAALAAAGASAVAAMERLRW